MRRYLSSLVLLLLSFWSLYGQDYAVELQTDKKVIYIDKLGLPDDTSLLEVLYMIPELVVREGNDFLSGYDLMLDSKSVAYNKNVILATMKLYEVDKIEISTSSTASQQINGMAGIIKIVSKEISEGFSGSATLDGNTLWTVNPYVDLNYRTGKLEINGNIGLQYYSNETSKVFRNELTSVYESGESLDKEHYFQETTRLYMAYTPTEKDKIKFWLLGGFDNDRRTNFVNTLQVESRPDMGQNIYWAATVADTNHFRASHFNLSAFAEYEHVFHDEMKFNFSADYISDVNKNGTVTLKGVTADKPEVVRSEAKFTLPFLPPGTKLLNMTLGGNMEYDQNDKTIIESRSIYASPFLELKYESPKWKLNSGVRYQHFDFLYGKTDEQLYSDGSDDVTFNVNTLFQLATHHALRFFVTRNIIRPTFDQMYPVMMWDVSRGIYVYGNRDLKPASMYSYDFDYVTDWNIGDHKFMADLRFGYDRTDGLFTMIQKYDVSSRKFYLTYKNAGVNDIFKTMADVMYRYGIFSVSLAGNWFHNIKREGGKIDNVDNFNIAMSPVFSFRNNWTLFGTFRYNDAMVSNTSRIGECIYASLRLSKSFGKWIVDVALSDIFGYLSENYEYKADGVYYTMYDQYPRCFNVGVTYRIGR